MQFYYAPGACSLAPHIALEEAGLSYQAIAVDLASHTLVADGSDYRQISPLGYVPLLKTAAGALSECSVVLQYIADQAPERGLIAAHGSMQRYQQQSMLNYIATEVQKNLNPLWIPTLDEAAKAIFKQRAADRLGHLDRQLAQHDYLTGASYGVDDIYGFVASSWFAHLGIDISHLTHLAAWQARIAQRPAVLAARQAEGLLGQA